MPIVLPLSSCSLLPFLHVYFHVVVNWFPHLSIATTPNTSLPASWVNRRMCPHGYERDSLKCYCFLAPTNPPPPTPRKTLALLRTSVSTLELDHSNSSSPFSRSLNGMTFPQVTGDGWRVANCQAVKNKNNKMKKWKPKKGKKDNKHYKKRYSNIPLQDIACTRKLEELINIKILFILRPGK